MTRQDTEIETFTRSLAREISSIGPQDLSDIVVERTRHAVLDWLAVTIAGSQEPVAAIAREITGTQGGADLATCLGTGSTVGVGDAALVNGLAAHALDFDSSSPWANGHPLTPVVASALALGEAQNASGAELLVATVAGIQAACVVGLAMGPGADTHGLHLTGYTGTFGAAAACGRVLNLNVEHLQMALSLAATQGAGLRAVFGSMGKHLNAARAGADGLLAARLVAHGFTAPGEAITGAGGYAGAFTDSFDPARPQREMGSQLGIEQTIFKFHSCCHGAHSTIEGIDSIRAERPFSVDQVERVRLTIPPGLLEICGISDPKSGVDGQFCLPYAAALALAGQSTGPEGFTDAQVRAPWSKPLCARVEVILGAPDLAVTAATTVEVEFVGGDKRSASVSVLKPFADNELSAQRLRLEAKFDALVTPVLGARRSAALRDKVNQLHQIESVRELTTLAHPLN